MKGGYSGLDPPKADSSIPTETSDAQGTSAIVSDATAAETKDAEGTPAIESEPQPEDAQDRVLSAIDKVLDEWFVTDIVRAGSKKFIQAKIGTADPTCERLRRWLLLRMNGRTWDHGLPLMCRTAENIPGLRGFHVWDRSEMPWLAKVEARYPEILQEILSVRAANAEKDQTSGFQPYRDPVSSGSKAAADGLGVEGVDRGMWNVLYLYLNHKKFEENCARFPITIEAITEAFPRQYSHAFFSALTPGTHIVKHHGPSNRMLRAWLPLCGLDGFKLRVGDTIVEPKAGEAFVWDHSFEHEAWHDGDETRVVLIVDIWHPDLTAAEVKFLGTLQNCRLRAGRMMLEELAQEDRSPEDATYFEIVEKNRHLLTTDDWWVLKAELDPTTKPT